MDRKETHLNAPPHFSFKPEGYLQIPLFHTCKGWLHNGGWPWRQSFLKNLSIWYTVLSCVLTPVVFSQESMDPIPFTLSPQLDHLLRITEVPHDGTLSSIVLETQKRWVRPAGKERWEVADWTEHKREEIMACAEKMGFLGAISPKKKHYTYCILLGATVLRMQNRVDTILQIWERGVRFHALIFLTGARPLDPAIEPLLDGCSTEGQAACKLWNALDLPEGLREIPTTFIEVPLVRTDGGFRRPNTQDTFAAWLKTSPPPGSCLLISNQPYCSYQDAIGRGALPAPFSVETVGSAADPEENGAILLDTIARWLYATEHLH